MRSSVRVALAALPLLSMVACSATVRPARMVAAGTYSGVSADGETVVVTLWENGRSIHGFGSFGRRPLAIGGTVGWAAVATIQEDGGSPRSARLRLSGSGERLTVEIDSGQTVELRRGGDSSIPPAGSFGGRFREAGSGPGALEVTLSQRGDLIAGVALLLGRAAGLTGSLVAAGEADVLVTLLDESSLSWRLTLSSDGRTLTVRGLGDARSLRRR